MHGGAPLTFSQVSTAASGAFASSTHKRPLLDRTKNSQGGFTSTLNFSLAGSGFTTSSHKLLARSTADNTLKHELSSRSNTLKKITVRQQLNNYVSQSPDAKAHSKTAMAATTRRQAIEPASVGVKSMRSRLFSSKQDELTSELSLSSRQMMFSTAGNVENFDEATRPAGHGLLTTFYRTLTKASEQER